jgi:hypothetical protein
MADYLKLFLEKRLSVAEPHHLEYIKGRLAAMKAENDARYQEFSDHYKFSVEVSVEDNGEETKKKRGRPAKVV